jgi:hypothetical protein
LAPVLSYSSPYTSCPSCQSFYNPYSDQFALGYGAYPWDTFGGLGYPGYPWIWGPWFFPPPIVVVPPIVRPPFRGPLRPPTGFRPPVARAAASNPAFTVTTDNADRTVISNEHPPVESLVEANSSEPAGTSIQHPLRVHPPVVMPAPSQQQTRMGNASTASSLHSSPSSQTSHPHTFSPSPSFSAAPAAASSGAHSSGGGAHH